MYIYTFHKVLFFAHNKKLRCEKQSTYFGAIYA